MLLRCLNLQRQDLIGLKLKALAKQHDTSARSSSEKCNSSKTSWLHHVCTPVQCPPLADGRRQQHYRRMQCLQSRQCQEECRCTCIRKHHHTNFNSEISMIPACMHTRANGMQVMILRASHSGVGEKTKRNKNKCKLLGPCHYGHMPTHNHPHQLRAASRVHGVN